MRIVGVCVLALGLGSSVVADDKANDADLKAMVGKWKVEKATLGGNDLTEMVKTLSLELLPGGKWKMVVGEEKADGTVTLDASKTPKELDVKTENGMQKGMTMKGIYKLDGDTMTVAYNVGGGERPKGFDAKGETTLLIVYKKAK